jgi:hypothetical protein
MSIFTSLLTSKTANNMVLGAIRTAMGAAIPAMVSSGWLPANAATGLLGSVLFLAALGLSIFDKLVRKQEIATTAVTVAQTTQATMAAQVAEAQGRPVTMPPIPNPQS